MLKEQLKQDLDRLNEVQLQHVMALVRSLQKQGTPQPVRFWQQATLTERIARLEDWPKHLPQAPVLPDEACDRGSIYE